MAGGMWAVRNITQALANQLVFMRTQRSDGRLPGMVTTDAKGNQSGTALTGEYCFPTGGSLLQGQYFSQPSVDVAWFMNVTRPDAEVMSYLSELAGVLERFNDWLSTDRSSPPGSLAGTFFLWNSADWGGDNSDVYNGYQPPFASMDMTAYAFSNAEALVRVTTLLGNASGAAHWRSVAEDIAAAFKRSLWSQDRSASFDVEVVPGGKTVNVLTHNNLRCMWHGIFDQSMAEAFIAKHLRNPDEFWTPFPLPSIAVNDPHYAPGLPRNNWSGPAEGLTYQRAVRALENYGFHAEVTLLGAKLVGAVSGSGTFPQQWNPKEYNGTPAGAAGHGDCYGPALLSLLEYTAYTHGIKPRPADGRLLWSDALPVVGTTAPHATNYTQVLGANTWTLVGSGSTFSGSRNGKLAFSCTRGVRVLTTLTGEVVGVVGISVTPVPVTLKSKGQQIQGTVNPNSEYSVSENRLVVTRVVPFKPSR